MTEASDNTVTERICRAGVLRTGRFVGAALAVALLVVPFLAGCGTAVGTAGGGPLASEPRTVSGVSAVVLETAGRLAISKASREALTIDAERSVLPYLTSDVVDGVLYLGVKDGTEIRSEPNVVYRLSVTDLAALTVTGAGVATFPGVGTSTFRLELGGSGRATLAGAVDHQDVTITGSGTYTGDKLASKSAKAAVSGSGEMLLQVTDVLDATITGSGSIAYRGNPTVTRTISGSGSLVQAT